MTKITIPQPMRVYTGGRAVVDIAGSNVRKLIDKLENKHPGMKAALTHEGKLKPDIAIMLNGEISRLALLQPLAEDDEIVIIPAITGG